MNYNKNRIAKNIISSILIVLIFCFSFITIVNFTFNFMLVQTNVRGFSMQPTINSNITDSNAEGDKIYINKYATLTNNDIVVASVDWYGHHIIKRVVGTPGDRVEIKDLGENFGVFVNNNLLYTKEKYGDNGYEKTGSYAYFEDYNEFLKTLHFQNNVERDSDGTRIVLHENEYLLMGDNWGHTTDSITKGVVNRNEILGKVEIIVDVENNNPFYVTLQLLKLIFS